MTIDTTTQIQRISKWIVNLRYEEIPEDVLSFAKLQLIDCIAAICAGSGTDAGVKLKAALEKNESGGPFTLLPHGESWSLDNVLYYHSAMINALELDDFVFMGHVSQSAVPVPLAIGQKLNIAGNELLLAVVAATEVSGRLASNLVIGPQQGHMRAFIHRIGGAAAVSKICGYDEETTAQAMAIALSMPEYPLYPACFSPDTKVICTSSPTIGGVKSAYMAEQAIDGPLDIIENPVGFYVNFSYNDYIPDIWRWIKDTWTLRTLSIKKFATCAYAQGSVHAAIQLKKNYTFSCDEIARVNIYVPLVTEVMEKFAKAHYGAGITPVNTHFSTIRSVAAALIYGELTGSFYQAGTFESKVREIEKLLYRVHLHHDWNLTILTLRGIDAGLTNAGKPGFLSLGGSRKTLRQFKEAFGSRPLIKWEDLYELARLPGKDLWYFLRRYFLSLSFPLFKINRKRNLDKDYSHEGDLGKMQFNLSGRVEIIFSDRHKISETCILPPGFADDPDRGTVVRDKFMREAIPVWGEAKSIKIMDMILKIEKYTVTQLLDEIKQA